ncbi:unnamed protein product [Cylindrotheca closterium]|uniref:Adaptor protein ClpS core domain-containing protein n=1 Tax=Cylindrotheca closterium TaxID=2856 RepID=A0AAD2JJJ1_9STRA|nr:unnamed protein product [Cylindrotheca closterium]
MHDAIQRKESAASNEHYTYEKHPYRVYTKEISIIHLSMSLSTSRFFAILILALFGFSQSFQIATQQRIQRHITTSSQRLSAAGPATLDPETIEKVDKEDAIEFEDKEDPGTWEVRLYNDPFNKREFVARCLSTICGKSDTESYQIMMQAHKNGMGVIGVYAFEVAELYYASLQDNGLMVEMVPVGDDDK